jgi:DNA-binding LacI/PurR family transcriptional regulator
MSIACQCVKIASAFGQPEVVTEMPTIREIARKAGVSHTVVSAILRGEDGRVRYSERTKRKVMRIAQQLGYRPHRGARSLAAKRTFTVGICFAWAIAEVTRHPAMAFVMAGASEVLGQHDYGLLLRINPSSEGYLPTPQLFHANEVDGVLLVGAIRHDDPHLTLWRKSALPMVLISTPPEHLADINSVDLDNFGMAAQAVNHLAQRGYRRLGLVLPGLDYTCHRENLRGFEHALSELGLPFRSQWVWTVGYSADEGHEFARCFFALKSRPEALVFLAEMAALGFARALIEHGVKVPDDLGLVVKEKFAGQMKCLPGVAALEPSYFQLGAVAAERLMGLIQKRLEPPVRERLPVPLRVEGQTQEVTRL